MLTWAWRLVEVAPLDEPCSVVPLVPVVGVAVAAAVEESVVDEPSSVVVAAADVVVTVVAAGCVRAASDPKPATAATPARAAQRVIALSSSRARLRSAAVSLAVVRRLVVVIDRTSESGDRRGDLADRLREGRRCQPTGGRLTSVSYVLELELSGDASGNASGEAFGV